MAEALVGTWNYIGVQNLDAYMDVIGVPQEIKDKAKELKPVLEIIKDGDVWTIRTTMGDKVNEVKYAENQEVDAKSLLGHDIKTIMKVEGGCLVETQKLGDGEVIIKRQVEGGNLLSTMSAKGVEAVATFTKA